MADAVYAFGNRMVCKKTEKRMKCVPGEDFLCQIPENSRYYLHPESEEPWIFCIFIFVEVQCPMRQNDCLKKQEMVFYADADSEPIRTALQMHRKLKNGYRSEPYECGVIFVSAFFVLFCGRYSVRSGSRHTFFVREAIRQMDTDCASVQGIEQLAEQSRVSFAHFTRCFREETGVSPMQYLQEARIRKAMTLLLNTGKSVEEIAAETGFSSGNYFGKVFRHHMGISPSAYRKERQNGAV